VRNFEVLFDESEAGAIEHPAYGPYGRLGFPPPPAGRPWIFTNFVQSLDGIASLRGRHAAGADIAMSEEDRWLMHLLRAHADAILYGLGTLLEEKRLGGGRGPVFSVRYQRLRELRQALGRRREFNIFVTGSGKLDLGDFKVFDGGEVDAAVITTASGTGRISGRESRDHVRVLEVFDGGEVDAAVITTASGTGRISGRESRDHVRVLVAGERDQVDLKQAVSILRQELGIRYLLCEGGPTLNGSLARAGLVDERFLTIAPVEVGLEVPQEQARETGEQAAIRLTTFGGPGLTKEEALRWRWLSCRRVGDHQFNRYRRREGAPG